MIDAHFIQTLIAAALWSFGAAAAFGYIYNIDAKSIVWAAAAGSCGWTVYTAVSALTGAQPASYFWGACCIAALAELFAIILKNPATVYLVPGLLPLVPGGGMFQTMREAVQGNMDTALQTGFTALTAAGAIALGVALASSAVRVVLYAAQRLMRRNTPS
ncbi:MAG TPA: threonine/serine exporter family protein [Candidatus Treponema faecavium]|nr:threonine/serine exporter family protein [Candidatus Treponema faecavium]